MSASLPPGMHADMILSSPAALGLLSDAQVAEGSSAWLLLRVVPTQHVCHMAQLGAHTRARQLHADAHARADVALHAARPRRKVRHLARHLRVHLGLVAAQHARLVLGLVDELHGGVRLVLREDDKQVVRRGRVAVAPGGDERAVATVRAQRGLHGLGEAGVAAQQRLHRGARLQVVPVGRLGREVVHVGPEVVHHVELGGLELGRQRRVVHRVAGEPDVGR
mmetsp:Transcript_37513/g.94701  ORF Transcript_37513/g.94701 Transcript_37513/m.94701 type:complete len:222 (+) Transcript_37513:282-947(+)